MKFAGRSVFAAAAFIVLCPASFARPRHAAAPPAKVAPTEKQLKNLARSLKRKNPSSAYARLGAFAMQKSSGVLGMRGALALGYFDYGTGRYAEAAKWLDRAKGDPLLRDYSLYWSAETDLALGRNADALAKLLQLRKDFPDSVMTEQALQSLGEAALASNRPADALAALDAYLLTPQRPALLFLRAEAREQVGQQLDAAADYQNVYMRFSLSQQAREAGMKLSFLRSSLGQQFPPIPLDRRFAHAGILFDAKDWGGARNEYAEIMPELTGADRERAELRVLECGVALGGGPSDLAALKVSDPDVDAERFHSLADFYRSQQQDAPMVAAVESAISRAPSSRWAEESLFLAGNYYWVQLDRDRAASYYKRLAEQFPSSAHVAAAEWRVAWTAVLKRQPDASEFLIRHLRRFPESPFTPDALYWLGRLAEEAGNSPLARSCYSTLVGRYSENYFQGSAAARLRVLDPGPKADSDALDAILPLPPVPKLDATTSLAAAGRQARADALRSIAFDASAELELRAAYAATGEPRLLVEAAQEAVEAGHYGAAIVAIRQIYPQLESHPLREVPDEVWKAAYALPFEASIRRWSAKEGVDPMLVAGLIHQESAFEPEARSAANAIGLMQLLPTTARKLAKQSKLRYSQAQLFDPDYNIRLGTIYFASLRKQFGSVESALAAYNAGEDRVTAWTAGQAYREPAEFVDSIPFTETRQYVEIVTRNADIYRKLYGVNNEFRKARTRRGR